MMAHLYEVIRERLGWCPRASLRRTSAFPFPEPDLPVRASDPAAPSAPVPALATPAEHRPEYQENLLLILVFLVGLFLATSMNLIIPFGLLGAILVYYDAENIHAGRKFDEVSLLGEVATWRPIVWAAAVLVGTIFLFAVYLFCRREVYKANN